MHNGEATPRNPIVGDSRWVPDRRSGSEAVLGEELGDDRFEAAVFALQGQGAWRFSVARRR
jgi:hypothetical protein